MTNTNIKFYRMQKSNACSSVCLACFLLLLLSCHKDPLTDLTSTTVEVAATISITDPDERARQALAQRFAAAINSDHTFRTELLEKLFYHKARVAREYFYHDFLDDRFSNGKTGAQIIYGSDAGGRSDGAVALDLVLKIPDYFNTFLWTKATLDMPVAAFAAFPMAFYPETKARSSSGHFLGYGDRIPEFSAGVYGVSPQGQYESHIPIHLKRSRQHLIVDRDKLTADGRNLLGLVSTKWPLGALECFENEVWDKIVVPQDFLPASDHLVNTDVLYALIRDCYGEPGEPFYDLRQNGPPTFGPFPPGEEICANGIDDDGDGLIDEADPDCQSSEEEEICDNGIDDDADGLIDDADPDCFSCPQSATFFRDCYPDFNRITGVQFFNVEWYNSLWPPVLAQQLPGMESNVELRFDIFYLTSELNCTGACPVNTFVQTDAHPVLSISVDDDFLNIENSPLVSSTEVFADPTFENFYSPQNSAPPYFTAVAYVDDQLPQSGSIFAGRVGDIIVNYEVPGASFSSDAIELTAYVTGPNWVPVSINYYPDGNQNWDPSKYGDKMHIVVHQADIETATLEEGQVVSGTMSSTFDVGTHAKFPQAYGAAAGSEPGENGLGVGYYFSTTQVAWGSQLYTLSADRVNPLTSFALTYRDTMSDERPVTEIIPLPTSTYWADNVCFGNVPNGFEAFYENWPGDIQLMESSPLNLLNLIRSEPE